MMPSCCGHPGFKENKIFYKNIIVLSTISLGNMHIHKKMCLYVVYNVIFYINYIACTFSLCSSLKASQWKSSKKLMVEVSVEWLFQQQRNLAWISHIYGHIFTRIKCVFLPAYDSKGIHRTRTSQMVLIRVPRVLLQKQMCRILLAT